MSLQQNINNSIFSLAHLNFIHSVSKDSKEMSQLFKDINDGKYAMSPEEIKKAEKHPTAKEKRALRRELKEGEKEFQEKKKLELMDEVNTIRKAKPKLTADEAELLARNIARKQAEYEKSLDKRAKKIGKKLERDRKHGKLGF